MKVAIIGGGVGGLTAAAALSRKGIECVVYEQAAEVAVTGASLQLGPNALRLMDDIGLLPALRDIGVRPEAVDFVHWTDGSLILHTPLGAPMEDYFGAPQLDFYRPDLHRVLLDALAPGAVIPGVAVKSVEQTDGAVMLELGDGSRVHADIAVAADRNPVAHPSAARRHRVPGQRARGPRRSAPAVRGDPNEPRLRSAELLARGW